MVSLFATKWTNPVVVGVPAVVTVVYIHPKSNESDYTGTILQVMQNIQSLSPEALNSILCDLNDHNLTKKISVPFTNT